MLGEPCARRQHPRNAAEFLNKVNPCHTAAEGVSESASGATNSAADVQHMHTCADLRQRRELSGGHITTQVKLIEPLKILRPEPVDRLTRLPQVREYPLA